jgi:hypothetical protein
LRDRFKELCKEWGMIWATMKEHRCKRDRPGMAFFDFRISNLQFACKSYSLPDLDFNILRGFYFKMCTTVIGLGRAVFWKVVSES